MIFSWFILMPLIPKFKDIPLPGFILMVLDDVECHEFDTLSKIYNNLLLLRCWVEHRRKVVSALLEWLVTQHKLANLKSPTQLINRLIYLNDSECTLTEINGGVQSILKLFHYCFCPIIMFKSNVQHGIQGSSAFPITSIWLIEVWKQMFPDRWVALPCFDISINLLDVDCGRRTILIELHRIIINSNVNTCHQNIIIIIRGTFSLHLIILPISYI